MLTSRSSVDTWDTISHPKRMPPDEQLGWPFVFYEWKASVIYYEYWSVWPLLADIAVVVLVST